MTSYLPFSISAPTVNRHEDIQVIVTPSAAVYHAGDTVTVDITFRHPEPTTLFPTIERKTAIPKLPRRLNRIGSKGIQPIKVVKNVPPGLYSPGANPQFRAPSTRDDYQRTIRKDGRRTQSLAIGKSVNPQEVLWALGRRDALRQAPVQEETTVKVLWATARLIGQFHPNNTYIPPDPLLPLRSLLLHQPVGSGSMESLSPWRLSFGTGALGNSTQPSLTGSLFGLAKGLVKAGGSLDEERKRVWNMKDLPVFEPAKSLLGVDFNLGERFEYTIKLPKQLPPSYRGRAFRFSYRLTISLGLDGRSSEVSVPIRVWGTGYDVLKPIIGEYGEAQGDVMEDTVEPSIKAVFDIAKEGQPFATLTLVKSVYRLGESVIGIVTLHRETQRFCALLESNEIIPETLLPPVTRLPDLTRVHAEHATNVANVSQFCFTLDIPFDASQGFSLAAGDGKRGGLEWGVRIIFWGEGIVNCHVPINVIRGNANFVAKPSKCVAPCISRSES